MNTFLRSWPYSTLGLYCNNSASCYHLYKNDPFRLPSKELVFPRSSDRPLTDSVIQNVYTRQIDQGNYTRSSLFWILWKDIQYWSKWTLANHVFLLLLVSSTLFHTKSSRVSINKRGTILLRHPIKGPFPYLIEEHSLKLNRLGVFRLFQI